MLRHLLGRLCEKRYRILVFTSVESFEALAETQIELSAGVQLFDLVGLEEVLKAAVVFFRDEHTVRTVQEHQVVYVVGRGIRQLVGGWLHAFNQVRDHLNPCFGLALHQKDDTFCEHFVVCELLLFQLEMRCPLQVVVSFIKVLLLYFNLSNLIESLASKVIVVVCPDYLFKVQNGIAKIVHLFEGFCFVKVCLAKCR